jgi:hypothetical protein
MSSKKVQQCIGAKCGVLVPETGLYTAERCKKACAEGSNLCLTCSKAEAALEAGEKKITDVTYQGRMNSVYPGSRIITPATARRVTAKKSPSEKKKSPKKNTTAKAPRALTETERKLVALREEAKKLAEEARMEAAARREAERAAKAAEKAAMAALTVVEEMTEDQRKEAEDELDEVEKQLKALTERRKVLTAKLGRTQRKTAAKKNSTRKSPKLNVAGGSTGFGASGKKNSSERRRNAAGGRNTVSAFAMGNYSAAEGNLF